MNKSLKIIEINKLHYCLLNFDIEIVNFFLFSENDRINEIQFLKIK